MLNNKQITILTCKKLIKIIYSNDMNHLLATGGQIVLDTTTNHHYYDDRH